MIANVAVIWSIALERVSILGENDQDIQTLHFWILLAMVTWLNWINSSSIGAHFQPLPSFPCPRGYKANSRFNNNSCSQQGIGDTVGPVRQSQKPAGVIHLPLVPYFPALGLRWCLEDSKHSSNHKIKRTRNVKGTWNKNGIVCGTRSLISQPPVTCDIRKWIPTMIIQLSRGFYIASHQKHSQILQIYIQSRWTNLTFRMTESSWFAWTSLVLALKVLPSRKTLNWIQTGTVGHPVSVQCIHSRTNIRKLWGCRLSLTFICSFGNLPVLSWKFAFIVCKSKYYGRGCTVRQLASENELDTMSLCRGLMHIKNWALNICCIWPFKVAPNKVTNGVSWKQEPFSTFGKNSQGPGLCETHTNFKVL